MSARKWDRRVGWQASKGAVESQGVALTIPAHTSPSFAPSSD